MNLINDQAREWLEKHSHQLPPEELPFEEEKIESVNKNTWIQSNGVWPVPKVVQNIGIFAKIHTQDDFNRIVGDPNHWEEILSRQDLYEQWILPNAVLLFSKVWFDRVKWKNSIKSGVPFSLFNENDKRIARQKNITLEDTSVGKSIIASIISKSSYALRIYLTGKWYKNDKTLLKKPGIYIIEAIRNDLIQQISINSSYKLKPILSCPFCLSFKKKVPLIEHGYYKYSCPKCSESAINYAILIKSLQEKGENCDKIKSLFNKLRKFKDFTGITCVCLSDVCSGKFIPIEFSDIKKENIVKILDYYSPVKGIQIFKEPPDEFKNVKFTCPYCDVSFTPSEAMKLKSGFKKMSGCFTGLPKVLIWENTDFFILGESPVTNNLTSDIFDPDFQIMARQKINIIRDALILNMSRVKKNSLTSLISWYFYMAAIKWTSIYFKDAFEYFFGWKSYERKMTPCEMLRYPEEVTKKVTKVIRGQNVSIHQSFFHTWMDILDENIKDFNRMNIYELKDFKWFCHRPKFSGGPKSTFRSMVNNRDRIPNKSNISLMNGNGPKPRLARILSIYKIKNNIIDYSVNYLDEMDFCEWHTIKLKSNSLLYPGDNVCVEAIMMSGHHSHAPIQRIIRLRSHILDDVIRRVLEEESVGIRDNEYWDKWNSKVSEAKKKVKINI